MPGPDATVDELLELDQPSLEVALDAVILQGADSVPTLRELEQRDMAKPLRKLVRRALHRLKTGGVDIGESERAAVRSVLRPVPQDLEQGAVTPLDPTGVRAFVLVVPRRGGCRIHDGQISDERGVLALKVGETGRRGARSFLRELPERSRGRATLVPAGSVRRLVQEAEDAARKALSPPPIGVSRLAISEILAGPIGPAPGEALRRELDSAPEPLDPGSARAMVEQRTGRGEVPAWLLAGAAINDAGKRLLQLETSSLVLSPARRQQQIEEIVSEASREILDEATCRRLARRLEETAVFLHASGDTEGARACLTLTQEILAPTEPAGNPYLQNVVRRACLAARGEAEPGSSGQLILPG